MSEQLMLFCERPHAKDVDFDRSRFVVCVGVGLNVAGKHLEIGDEIPKGSLTALALRQEYEAAHRIESLTFASTVPSLREACARRGVAFDADPELVPKAPRPEPEPPAPKVFLPDLADLSREDLVEMCIANGLTTHGKNDALYRRVKSFLER